MNRDLFLRLLCQRYPRLKPSDILLARLFGDERHALGVVCYSDDDELPPSNEFSEHIFGLIDELAAQSHLLLPQPVHCRIARIVYH